MSTSKSKKHHKPKSWWRSSRHRNKIGGLLFSILAVAAVGGFAWLALSGGGREGTGGDNFVALGKEGSGIRLPDIVSRRDVSVDDYVGEKEIVIVGYMGFF